MFRTLGLRHMPVVNKDFELQGIITRRNFIEPHHKSGDKKTTYELSTLRLFMPTAPLEVEEEIMNFSEGNDGEVMLTLINGDSLPLESVVPPTTTVVGDIGETML